MNKNIFLTVYKIKGLFQVIIPIIILLYFTIEGVNIIYLALSFLLGIFGWLLGSAVVHRIFSHRVIDIESKFLQFILGYLATVTIITPPISWAGNHYLHHKYSDTTLDPHSPIQIGFWKSLLFLNHQDFSEIVSKLKPREIKRILVSIRHLTKSKPLMFIEKNFAKIILVHISILYFFSVTSVIYIFCIPVAVSHLAEMLVVANHGGFLGGEPSNKKHEAHNKFRFWMLSGLEFNHSDHHDDPRNDDLFNRIIRKINRLGKTSR